MGRCTSYPVNLWPDQRHIAALPSMRKGRIQEAGYRDVIHRRQLWCDYCKRWIDRDVVAAMNIARKGAAVFQRSQGLAGEAMKWNPTTPVILRVDASKLAFKARADIVNRTYENQIYP